MDKVRRVLFHPLIEQDKNLHRGLAGLSSSRPGWLPCYGQLGIPEDCSFPRNAGLSGSCSPAVNEELGTRARTKTNSLVSASVYQQEDVRGRWSPLSVDRSCRVALEQQSSSAIRREMVSVKSLPGPPDSLLSQPQQGRGW